MTEGQREQSQDRALEEDSGAQGTMETLSLGLLSSLGSWELGNRLGGPGSVGGASQSFVLGQGCTLAFLETTLQLWS